MSAAGLARRYVLPLFEAAESAGRTEQVEQELRALDQALRSAPDLRAFLLNPALDRATKREAITPAVEGFSDLTRNFVRVVMAKNRPWILEQVYRIFRDLHRARRGVTPATVETAVPLDEAVWRDIQVKLEKRFRSSLEIERRVEPGLLGGLRVRVGNVLWDASVKGRLERLREALTGQS